MPWRAMPRSGAARGKTSRAPPRRPSGPSISPRTTTTTSSSAQVLFKLKKYPEALKAAEKAVELVKPMAVKYEGFPIQQYENLVKQIKDAMAQK